MTPEEAVLERVVSVLDAHGIPYMVTGSVASSYHGRPRATHDADVVIDPTAAQFDAFVSDLELAQYFVNAEGAQEALRRRSQFNVIDLATATKLDVIIRKDRPFSVEEFGRRQRVDMGLPTAVAMVTAEDAILSKLEWARRSGDSERQIRDAAGVLELNPEADRRYIATWADHLGITELWRQIARLP